MVVLVVLLSILLLVLLLIPSSYPYNAYANTLWTVAAIATADVDSNGSFNTYYRYGPHFEDIPAIGNVTNITVPIGNAVYLNCRISLLTKNTVRILNVPWFVTILWLLFLLSSHFIFMCFCVYFLNRLCEKERNIAQQTIPWFTIYFVNPIQKFIELFLVWPNSVFAFFSIFHFRCVVWMLYYSLLMLLLFVASLVSQLFFRLFEPTIVGFETVSSTIFMAWVLAQMIHITIFFWYQWSSKTTKKYAFKRRFLLFCCNTN